MASILLDQVIAVPAKRIDHPVKTLSATVLSALILCSGFAAFSTLDGGSAGQPQNGHLVMLPAMESRPPAPRLVAQFTPTPAAIEDDDAIFADPQSDYYMDPNSELYVDTTGIRRDAAYEIGQGYQPA